MTSAKRQKETTYVTVTCKDAMTMRLDPLLAARMFPTLPTFINVEKKLLEKYKQLIIDIQDAMPVYDPPEPLLQSFDVLVERESNRLRRVYIPTSYNRLDRRDVSHPITKLRTMTVSSQL